MSRNESRPRDDTANHLRNLFAVTKIAGTIYCIGCGSPPFADTPDRQTTQQVSIQSAKTYLVDPNLQARLAALDMAVFLNRVDAGAPADDELYANLVELEIGWPMHDQAVHQHLLDVRDILNARQLHAMLDFLP